MTFRLSIFAVLLFLPGCRDEPESNQPSSEKEKELPTIYIDAAHNQSGREDDDKALRYTINPAKGLILDFSKCGDDLTQRFAEMKCNSIQLVFGNHRQYRAEFDPSLDRQILDPSTLWPHPGSDPFDGIEEGNGWIIAIGTMKEVLARPSQFSVAWVSMIDVQ